MKKVLFILMAAIMPSTAVFAQNQTVSSPDEKLKVTVGLDQSGTVVYDAVYNGKTILEKSPLGLVTNISDFSKGLTLADAQKTTVSKEYGQSRIKQSHIDYNANGLTNTYVTDKKEKNSIVFQVSNNNIAIKYLLPKNGEAACCVIQKEMTGFKFPSFTTTFLSPQATPMIGWKRSKPSYEEEYVPDEPVGTKSKYGVGYTFPGLFHVGDNGWALVSETGVSSLYCASKLSEGSKDGLYTVAFPEPGENNGVGSNLPSVALPGETPWRIITVGDNLKPIVETTIPFDVVDPLYKPSMEYQFGRGTWSWIMWQDNSINYDDQVAYIDLAAAMGYEYVLVDANWDKNIGYERMAQLIKYAKSKSVDLFLWYNSNGRWNDTPGGPTNIMCNTIKRKEAMKWLKENGVKGLKVDFFGGDKQETMKLYEDILSDANDYGLMIIFHGCTLPRGWERMYPNYVGSEAVLASENLIFNQHFDDAEAYNACLHPFIRNTVGSMEFGPVLLNKRHNRENNGGRIRKTTDVFQLATSVLFQNAVQMFAIAPNNLKDSPDFVIDFMKNVPTTWDETVFIDGYPGKYCVLARRHADSWYVVAVNAEKQVKKINVVLPMLAGKQVNCYSDRKDRTSQMETVKVNKSGKLSMTLQPDGATIYELRN